MNYIIWNNKDSRDIKGLLISELPPIRKPNMRVKETVIDGVDGSIIEELGYESYDRTVVIGLKIGADVDKISEFFTGSGKVVFSNEPDKYYIATIIKNIDYERLLRYKVAKVTFRVQPFKYNRVELPREATAERTSMIIENLGNHTAKPIITIKAKFWVELSVNEEVVCEYYIENGQDEEFEVVIDSEKQDAYCYGTDGEIKLLNRYMSGEFPILQKGNNTISWDSYKNTLESIKIEKYSRWL
jgi:predicted phage tail component-like protein